MSKPKPIPVGLAFLPLIIMFVLAICSGTILKIQLEWVMIFSTGVAVTIALCYGHTFKSIETTMGEKISEIWTGILILMLIGGIVGSWMYSGTVPMLIYYGIILLHPSFVPIGAFIVATAVSMFTGTSWGSVATAGVAFMGVATALGVPLPLVAGAIISGAFFGDKNSPISDMTVISALAARTDVYSHVRSMLYTSIPAVIISIVLYIVLGIYYAGDTNLINTDAHRMALELESIYNFNILLLIPPAIVFIGAIYKVPALIVMTLGAFVALILGVFFQGFSFIDATNAFVNGFNLSMKPNLDIDILHPTLVGLLNRGGMASMMQAVRFAAFAVAFGSVLQVMGVFDMLVRYLSRLVKGVFSLTCITWFSSMIINSVVGSGQFALFISGDIMRDSYKKYKLSPNMLSRTLEEGVTLTGNFFPWHGEAIYMATILGVVNLTYLPYAFFNIFSILTMFIYAIIYPKIKFGTFELED